MNIYNIPAGFQSFEAVAKVFQDQLPEKYKIIKSVAGGKLPGQNGILGMGKPKAQSQLVGTIHIKQNSYNGLIATLTTTDGVPGGSLSVEPYVPSWIVEFLRGKVLGFLTNLIFPAIYGTGKKLADDVHQLVMNNFGAELYDNSFGSSMKSMFKGESLKVKESSVNP